MTRAERDEHEIDAAERHLPPCDDCLAEIGQACRGWDRTTCAPHPARQRVIDILIKEEAAALARSTHLVAFDRAGELARWPVVGRNADGTPAPHTYTFTADRIATNVRFAWVHSESDAIDAPHEDISMVGPAGAHGADLEPGDQVDFAHLGGSEEVVSPEGFSDS